jgi:aldose 1-epimerase
MADGWHPYFTLGGKSNDWELSFHASKMLEFSERLIPTGETLQNKRFQSAEKIADGFLDNCFVLDGPNGKPACILSNPDNGLSLLFFPGKFYPYLQIYTPAHRDSIAIENLSGAPDCFNNGLGLIVLAPGQSQTFTLGYQLRLDA